MNVIDYLVLYETLAELYYKRFDRLAPGKYEAPETGRDSNEESNREQWDAWIKTQALTDAISELAELKDKLRQAVEDREEESSNAHPCYTLDTRTGVISKS